MEEIRGARLKPDTKPRKRTEEAAADRAKRGDSCSAKRAGGSRTSSTRLGMTAEPLTLPRRDAALVDKGAEAPKLCLSPVEVSTLTAAGGLLPASTATTVTLPF